MRLNQFIAHASGVSRREADQAIADGRVSVNGKTAGLGQSVDPQADYIALDNKPARIPKYTYILMNKPTGYVCSRKAQDEAPTIYTLLPNKFHHLKTAGRLDKDSSGLVILTDDGEFAQQMTHPTHGKQKVYEAVLDWPLSIEDKKAIEQGIKLPDGVSSLKLTGSGKTWTVSMNEGRNRQIRRTFGTLGYTVIKLHRTQFGAYTLAGVQDTFSLIKPKLNSISIEIYAD